MPDGTPLDAHVADTCVTAGKLTNKKPIFIKGFSNASSFLAFLLSTCPGGLNAQIRGEKLIVVLSTADGFRAAVSAMRSLDGKVGASFHTFMLTEDRCVRLLLKNLEKGMPQSLVR
jgi:hypothetical protein